MLSVTDAAIQVVENHVRQAAPGARRRKSSILTGIMTVVPSLAYF
jgi:hypothetical protein